jgi:hypothetical protein
LSNGLAHNFEFGTIHLEIKGFEYHKMQNWPTISIELVCTAKAGLILYVCTVQAGLILYLWHLKANHLVTAG